MSSASAGVHGQEVGEESRDVVPPRVRGEDRRRAREALDVVVPEEDANELAVGGVVGPHEPRQCKCRDDERAEQQRTRREAPTGDRG